MEKNLSLLQKPAVTMLKSQYTDKFLRTYEWNYHSQPAVKINKNVRTITYLL